METERLILRRWEDSDAEDLFKYASDSDVGPIVGWPSHQSIDESRDVIKNVLNGAEVYAVCLKEDERAIGAIELKLNGHTDMTDRDDECELGYWLGKPFWGQGIMPEAVKEMLRHAFEDCGMQKVWIGYYEGNTKSKRVQEKCGFKYQWRSENVDVPLMHEKRTGHVSLMTREDWETMPEEKLKEVQSHIQYIIFRDAGNVLTEMLTEEEIVEQLTKPMEKSDMGATTAASVVSQRMREKYGSAASK